LKAAKFSENFNGNNESSSDNESIENQKSRPKRLSSNFTKFDILEQERVEKERKRIREWRKALLEEERKLFEETKRQKEKQNAEELEYFSESPEACIAG